MKIKKDIYSNIKDKNEVLNLSNYLTDPKLMLGETQCNSFLQKILSLMPNTTGSGLAPTSNERIFNWLPSSGQYVLFALTSIVLVSHIDGT